MNELRNINNLLSALNDDSYIKLLSYSNDLVNDSKNQSKLMCTKRFIED